MKFEFSDDTALMLSGVGLLAYGVPHLVAAGPCQDYFYNTTAGRNEAGTQWTGFALAGPGAATVLSLSTLEGSTEAKKNVLKTHGCLWLTAAALNLYHTFGSDPAPMKKEIGLGNVIGCSLVGALVLSKGLEE